MDIILTVIFILEALMKIIAFGFINSGPESYAKNNWNLLDFSIALISVNYIKNNNVL